MTQHKVISQGYQVPMEIYNTLEQASSEERALIVLDLIENHPDGRLELPLREDGKGAYLREIDLSQGTMSVCYEQWKKKHPNVPCPWWDAKMKGISLRGARLQNAYMSDANLQGVNFFEAELQGADLVNTNLQDSRLVCAKLHKAHLRYADLRGASIGFSDLSEADLRDTNMQEADLEGTDLRMAQLNNAKLQGVDLSHTRCIHSISISGAWLDMTKLRPDQLEGGIGEELKKAYNDARLGYLILKQNFNGFGDYNSVIWAYCQERHMERKILLQAAKKAREESDLRKMIASYSSVTLDYIVEILCSYGEGFWKLIGWMLGLLIVVGPIIIDLLGGVRMIGEAAEYYKHLSPFAQWFYGYFQTFLYVLDTFTTASFAQVEPLTDRVRLASGFLALLGIFLAGLLGFVAGNRIRRT
jgi:uncharacterized protein YjbI with pentapeptide repeats